MQTQLFIQMRPFSGPYFVLLIISYVLLGCQAQESELSKADQTAILQVISEQTQAWNTGSHEGFMDGYWNSPDLRFFGPKGGTYGWQKVLANYQRSFPNLEDMRTLDLHVDSIYALRYPLVSVTGSWHIYRSDSASGRFVLLFDRVDNGSWKIVQDHTW